MSRSMLYTRVAATVAYLLLAACASQQAPTDTPSQQKIDKAIQSTSSSDIQKYRQAISLLSAGELEKAKLALIEFTEDRPQLAGPWANLGLIYIKQNRPEEAERYLDKAIERNPELAQAYNLKAYIEKSKGNILKSVELYKKAVSLKDNYAIAHYNLALLYDIYIQDIPKAVAHYQKYISLIKKKDKQTADWLEQLRASMKKG